MLLFARESLLEVYYYLLLTRRFEELLVGLYAEKALPEKPMTSIGQEATAVGATYCLRADDYVLPALRTRGAYFTKGVSVREYLLEVFRRADGISGGKWTAHHMGDMNRGIILGSAVVASSLPVAVGTALSARIRGTDQVTLAFFGDGASSTGASHSSLNFASVMSLPIVFVCENNQYSLSTPLRLQTRNADIADRAIGYGIEGDVVDGQDVVEVIQAVSRAVHRARRGSGPALIECKTYHFRGHSESHHPDDGRPAEELRLWRSRDPLEIYSQQLHKAGVLDAEMEEVEGRVTAEIEEALKIARDAADPSSKDLVLTAYA
jgi:TPP-dependent pyruvate/acetoin dehydrogenase alpha subunit